MKHNILYFPWRDWNKMTKEGFRTREANILLSLMKRSDIDKIICVNRSKMPILIEKLIGLLKKEQFFQNSNEKIEKKSFKVEILKTRFFSKIIRINEKLYIVDINYHLPNPKGNKLEKIKFFQKILVNEIKSTLQYLNIIDYTVWGFDLTRASVAHSLKQDLFIFDAIDNLLEHDDFKRDKKTIKTNYNFVKVNANPIFTVSEDIKNNVFDSLSKVHYVPNGINLEYYNGDYYERPSDLPVGKPLIGYVGLMQERIDIKGLEILVKKMKGFNFIFVGPVLKPKVFEQLKNNKNVFFLGAKHHSQIPSYIKNFDICIIPHVVNNFTKSMNPLKLYEYLAAGIEIITTPVPPFDRFKNIVHVVNSTVEMAEVIEEIRKKPFNKFSIKDIENEVIKETWENRVDFMMTKIGELKHK